MGHQPFNKLTIHEQAHLAHLLRPSRNRTQQILGDMLGLGPITLRAPRWAIEGYATVIEGDLTAAGRPQSDFRASIPAQVGAAGKVALVLAVVVRLAELSRDVDGLSRRIRLSRVAEKPGGEG